MLRKARELGIEAARQSDSSNPREHDVGEDSRAYRRATEQWDEWSTWKFCDVPTHGRPVTVAEGNAAHAELLKAYEEERAKIASEKAAQGTDKTSAVQEKKSGRKRRVA